MILPSKYLREQDTLIGVGAIMLKHLYQEKTLSSLWDLIKNEEEVATYERFVLGLDFLFILGLIDINSENKVKRVIT